MPLMKLVLYAVSQVRSLLLRVTFSITVLPLTKNVTLLDHKTFSYSTVQNMCIIA
jgi:hypothetical protein